MIMDAVDSWIGKFLQYFVNMTEVQEIPTFNLYEHCRHIWKEILKYVVVSLGVPATANTISLKLSAICIFDTRYYNLVKCKIKSAVNLCTA